MKQSDYLSEGALAVVDQGQDLVGGFTDVVDAASRVELPVIIFGDHTRAVKFIDFPFAVGADGVKVLKARPGVDSRYLYRYLETVQLTDGGYSRHFKYLKEIDVPLPSVEEQRRIAAVLDAADALRTKRREAVAKLRALTRAIFMDMLDGEWMPLAAALGDAPLFTDGDWVESKDQDPVGTIRLTQLADVGVGRWLDKSRRFMNEESAGRLNCTFLQPGDVLVARMPDPIGRACIFPGDEMPCVTAVDVCIIRPNSAHLEVRWLVEALNLPSIQREIQRRATGTTRSRVSRRNLGKVLIPVPDIDHQRAFAVRAVEVDSQRRRLEGSIRSLDDLFSSLQQRAFRGEL